MTMKRFALFRGKKGHLVGHPDQTEAGGASYFCQRQKPIDPDAMKGFGEPDYSGPEVHELYEPMVQIVELTQRNAKLLEKAVKAGHLDRSAIFHFGSMAEAEKSRSKLEASLVEAVKRAAADKARAAAEAASRKAEPPGVDESLEAERALLRTLDDIESSGVADEPIPSTERPIVNIGPAAIESARE